jgi:hypothetical protein
MSKIQVDAWKCDKCGHVWLVADADKKPRWCAKCKARSWNQFTELKQGLEDAIANKPSLPMKDVKTNKADTWVNPLAKLNQGKYGKPKS